MSCTVKYAGEEIPKEKFIKDLISNLDLSDEQEKNNQKYLKSIDYAFQKSSAESLPVQPKAEDSEGVSKGNSEREETASTGEEKEERLTGIRNADVAEERDANIARERKSFADIDKEGKRMVDSGETDPNDLAKDIISGKKKSVTAEDEAALLYHKTRLNNRQNAILNDTDPTHNAENQAEYSRNEDLLEQNRKATELAGNVAGRSLAYRRQLMKSDYSLATLLRRAKLFNGGEDVDEATKSKLAEHSKRIANLENQLADREEQIRKLSDKNTISEVKRNAEFEDRRAKRTTTKASLRKEREDLVAELHTIARNSLKTAGANKIPIEMLPTLAKLARNYVMDGAVSIAQVADKIYNEHFKDKYDGIHRDDVEDAIKNEFDKYLHEKNFERLSSAKKRQETKLADLKSGNYEKKVYSKIQVDNDYLHIRAEINREQAKLNKRMEDIANSKKGAASKIGNLIVKYGRQAKLASVTVIGKLGLAGLTTAGLEPVQEGVGWGFSKVFKKIADKSSYEGSVSRKENKAANEITEGKSVKNFTQAYARAATQGMKDAYDEIRSSKGKQSDISALYGKNGKLPAEAAEFFGHIHSAIKAPVKRFIWEKSYAKRLAKGIQAGVDITDPIIDARYRLDAYKDAEKAIFMGDNHLSNAYEQSVKYLETRDNPYSKFVGGLARVLFPFVKVPSNIAAETLRYSFGLTAGLAKVGRVYASSALKEAGAIKLAKFMHKGMGELSPDEADIVLKNLKRGSVGGAALAIGFFAPPKNIGGYYQKGYKESKSKANPDQFMIGDAKIPIWMTEHPVFQAMQIGATFRKLLDKNLNKDDRFESAFLGTASGVSENIPLAEGAKQISDALLSGRSTAFNKYVGDVVKGEVTPSFLNQLAEVTDTKNGSPITFRPMNQNTRKPNNKQGLGKYLKEDLETGVPGLREKVSK